MKERYEFFNQFNNLPYFTKESLQSTAERFGIKSNTLDSYITKSLKDKTLVKFKRNHYSTKAYFEKSCSSTDYIFYISNILLQPSYVSLESALEYYGLIPEALGYVRTAITTHTTREFRNNLGKFTYRNITEELFADYNFVQLNNGSHEYRIAKPYKAIFDYIYYKTNQFTSDFSKDILFEYRIDTTDLKKGKKKKLQELFLKYSSKEIHL